MTYKEALRACLDGKIVRCVRWGNDKVYHKYLSFTNNALIFTYCDGNTSIASFGWLSDYADFEWEIVMDKPKFNDGDFVIMKDTKKYAKIIKVEYSNIYNTYLYGISDGNTTHAFKEESLIADS